MLRLVKTVTWLSLCLATVFAGPLASAMSDDDSTGYTQPCNGQPYFYGVPAGSEAGSGATKPDAKKDAIYRATMKNVPECSLCPWGVQCPSDGVTKFIDEKIDGPFWDPHNQEWVVIIQWSWMNVTRKCEDC